MGEIVFVTGGARSGKSRFAESRATASQRSVVYLATMQPGDAELAARVERHLTSRPTAWQTVEEPLDLVGALVGAPPAATIVLDCLSLWVSNRLFAALPSPGDEPLDAWDTFVEETVAAAGEVLAAQVDRPGSLIAVSNEVGSGIVPVDRLSRYYRDALGFVNQSFAAAANEAHLLVSGLPLRLR